MLHVERLNVRTGFDGVLTLSDRSRYILVAVHLKILHVERLNVRTGFDGIFTLVIELGIASEKPTPTFDVRHSTFDVTALNIIKINPGIESSVI
jgi:hypothetical protein